MQERGCEKGRAFEREMVWKTYKRKRGKGAREKKGV